MLITPHTVSLTHPHQAALHRGLQNGALLLTLGGAIEPIFDAAGCATGWGCGPLRADANPVNWAKGIWAQVTLIGSDIAHGHLGGAAGTSLGIILVGGRDPAGLLRDTTRLGIKDATASRIRNSPGVASGGEGFLK